MTPRPEIRIGDAEREAAVAALGEHYAAGRLTKEEYDERAEQAWAARTASALAPLFGDLPAPHAAGPAATPPAAARQAPAAANRPPWQRLPLVPVLFVLVGLVLLAGFHGGVLLLVLGLWWLAASLRWRRRWGAARWQRMQHAGRYHHRW